MRYGCCLNMVATGADKMGVEHLKELAAAGYDYAELPLAEMMALQPKERKNIRIALEQAGIPCEVCNNFFPGSMRLTGKNVDMDAVLGYADRALTFAGTLGVKRVVFGSGKAKNVPEGFPMEEGYQQVAALLKQINRIAERENLIIAIEPLRKAECNLINTFEEGCHLAKEVGGDNVKVLVDFYHLTEEDEPLAHIEESGRDYLQHVHFAEPQGRVYPVMSDMAKYEGFAEVLKRIGYDQRISCEAYTDSYRNSAKETLEVLKKVFG